MGVIQKMGLVFSNLFVDIMLSGIAVAIGACFMLLGGLLLKSEKLSKAGVCLYFMSCAVVTIGGIGFAITSIGGI